MRKKTLSPHYITLFVLCQVFCLFFHSLTVSAASNSIIIDCPNEITPNKTISCTISSNSTIKIDKITGNFVSDKLTIKNVTSSSPWTLSNENNKFTAESTTKEISSSKLGSIEITTAESDTVGSILIENLIFSLKDQYSFTVAGPSVEIKVLPAPELPTCAEDEELIDGVCQKKNPTCKEDEELVDGVCQKKTPICKDDEELVNGICKKKTPICAEDEELINGACEKKVPTCKEGEILVRNVCVVDANSKFDFTQIILIIGLALLVAGIIIAIILISKKSNRKKKEKEQSHQGSYLNTSNMLTGKGMRDKTNSSGNFLGGQSSSQQTAVPSNIPQPPKQLNYDNGSYMSRTGEVSEAGTMPPKNDDPRLQMKIENSSGSALEEKGPSAVPINQTSEARLSESPDDPRLQIQFNKDQQAMSLRTNSNSPLTSAYEVATQAAPEPTAEPKKVIQEAQTPVQPVGPTANQYPSAPIETKISQPTQSVELTKPTSPDVFES